MVVGLRSAVVVADLVTDVVIVVVVVVIVVVVGAVVLVLIAVVEASLVFEIGLEVDREFSAEEILETELYPSNVLLEGNAEAALPPLPALPIVVLSELPTTEVLAPLMLEPEPTTIVAVVPSPAAIVVLAFAPTLATDVKDAALAA